MTQTDTLERTAIVAYTLLQELHRVLADPTSPTRPAWASSSAPPCFVTTRSVRSAPVSSYSKRPRLF
jgi:hypothetical protein